MGRGCPLPGKDIEKKRREKGKEVGIQFQPWSLPLAKIEVPSDNWYE